MTGAESGSLFRTVQRGGQYGILRATGTVLLIVDYIHREHMYDKVRGTAQKRCEYLSSETGTVHVLLRRYSRISIVTDALALFLTKTTQWANYRRIGILLYCNNKQAAI
jgi:hypothetical protein